MNLSAYRNYIRLVAIIIGVLGWMGHYITIPFVTNHNFGFVLIAFWILSLSTLIEKH